MLQIEYPHNIHLIRGNHEATDINALFGFRTECIERMVPLISICCHYLVYQEKIMFHIIVYCLETGRTRRNLGMTPY